MDSTALAMPQQHQIAANNGETASTAAAATAKALVEARYLVAFRRPRSWDQVRQDVLRECRRPGFAENKSTLYNKPVGDGIEGLGIRFVEAALRCMTNVLQDSMTTYDDAEKEIVRVSMTELESNTTYSLDVKIVKQVERSKPLDDGGYIAVRTNSRGKKTYTVPATDEDLLNKRGALISKAIRTLGLRVIPGDIQDEAEGVIRAIRLDKAAADPAGERKRIVDAFGEIGVRASDLVEYLGHDIGQCSPAELVKLRGYYGAIRDGQTTWKEIVDSVSESRTSGAISKINEGLKPATAPTAAAATFDSAPSAAPAAAPSAVPGQVSFAKLVDRMQRATDLDILDADASLISSLPADQQSDATTIYKKRRGELEAQT